MHGNTLILDAFWVSNKPFPTMQPPNYNDGRAFHDYYYGNARYLGWLDLVLLKDIIKKHHINHIILQNLDVFGQIAEVTKEIKVCVAYEYHKFIIRSFEHDKHIAHSSAAETELLQCKPIYQTVEFGGWELSDDSVELPSRAKLYIRYLIIHTRVDFITYMNNKFKITARFDFLGNVIFETEAFE